MSGGWAVLFTEIANHTRVPATLSAATIKAGLFFRLGRTALPAGISKRALNMAEQLFKGAVITKIKWAAFIFVVLGLAAPGVGGLVFVTFGGKGARVAEGSSKAPGKSFQSLKAAEEGAGHDHNGDPLPTGAVARLGTVRLRREDSSAGNLAFTPDGQTLVSARTDKVIQFWDVKTGKPLYDLHQDTRFEFFGLSTDAKLLATAGFEDITVWDVINRKHLRKIRAGEVLAFAVDPDGRALVLCHSLIVG